MTLKEQLKYLKRFGVIKCSEATVTTSPRKTEK